MTDFKKKVMDFLRDEEGLETVEYAVVGSLVVALTVTAFTTLGDSVVDKINTLIEAIGGEAVSAS